MLIIFNKLKLIIFYHEYFPHLLYFFSTFSFSLHHSEILIFSLYNFILFILLLVSLIIFIYHFISFVQINYYIYTTLYTILKKKFISRIQYYEYHILIRNDVFKIEICRPRYACEFNLQMRKHSVDCKSLAVVTETWNRKNETNPFLYSIYIQFFNN